MKASHDLSRFLYFGKEGVLPGREFGDKAHTFTCLSVLHNAVLAWNMIQIGEIVDQFRAEGREIDDETLSHVTPLLRKHINRSDDTISTWIEFGSRRPIYAEILNGGFRLDVATTSIANETNVQNLGLDSSAIVPPPSKQ